MEVNKNFLDQYKNLVYSNIRAAGIKDNDTIDILFSDVIIRVLEHNNYDGTKAAISTWLTLVTRSVVGNYLKHKAASTDALDKISLSLQEVSGKIDRGSKDYLFKLKEVISTSKLPALWKTILINKYVLGYSHKELADLLELPPHTIRKTAERAIRRLEKSNVKEGFDSWD